MDHQYQEHPHQEQSTTATSTASTNKMMTRSTTLSPPPTPPVIRPTIRLSSSFSPPPTPGSGTREVALLPNQTPNRQRQAAWWQSSVVRRSSSAVDEAVDELTEKSKFLLLRKRSSSGISTTPRSSSSCTSSDPNNPYQHQRLDCTTEEEEDVDVVREIATFHRDEIVTGELLGQGTFNCVYEVKGFDIPEEEDDDDNPTRALRKDIINSIGQRSFALKHLKHELLDDTLQFEQAATDLVMEAKYLAALDHPNILKIHGEPTLGTAAINNGVDGYFLLTDRLSETLAQRIERWKEASAAEDPTNTVMTKLQYGLQIAQALQYLHQQRILFRDLKPSNIGFHQDDNDHRIQLFDFGLVRELPSSSQARPYIHGATIADVAMDSSEYSLDMELGVANEESWSDEEDNAAATNAITASPKDYEDVYHMSGAGTQIYMAPEVLLQNKYNLKADVYSWSMVVSEMLLLEKPLPQYEEMDDHIQYVCLEGDRPNLPMGDDCDDPQITDALRDLLAWAWEGNVLERCTISQVCDELSEIITQLEDEDQEQDQQDLQDHHHHRVATAMASRWSSRFFQAANRFQQYLISVVGRTLQRFSSFLLRRRRRRRQDVTFDLSPQAQEEEDDKRKGLIHYRSSLSSSDNTSSSYYTDATFPTAETTEGTEDPMTPPPSSAKEEAALLLSPSTTSTTALSNSISSNNDDCVLLAPRLAAAAPPLTTSHPRSNALLKRKPSSASTTATTDDEFDDDDLLSLGIPPTSPSYFKPPCMPLEALTERHNSNASTTTTTTNTKTQ